MPTIFVLGVPIDDPLPPVADVYHFRLVPVAESGDAETPSQDGGGVVAVGGDGAGFTVTTSGVFGPSHAFVVA